jgi:2-hydroxychromene-2-carboxylate isomerase
LALPAGGVYRAAMPSPIDFCFDFSSPYSYIAGEWVDALAARHGRTVRRQAILLGATFQAAELKPPVAHPIKREYSMHDFARSARFEGVPYQMPPVFPIPTQNAARVFWWLADTQGDGAAAAWATAGLRAVFTRGVPLHEAQALRELAAAAGPGRRRGRGRVERPAVEGAPETCQRRGHCGGCLWRALFPHRR